MPESNDRTGKNWVLGVTALASFMMALDAQVITTAFATIRSDFSASVETLQWTVNAYNLSFAVLLLTGAALGDRFGRRRMFAAGIALFVLASVACALSGSARWLIAARAAQGAGAALVMPLAMAILSGAFAREERARALGIFSGVTGFALIIGPAIGGFITESLGWRWIFWVNVPIGMIAIVLVLARLRESFGPAAGLDITGLVITAASALALVWGLLRGNALGWANPEVVGALALGVLFASRIRGVGTAGAGADGADAVVPVAGVCRRRDRELSVLRGHVRRIVSVAAIPASLAGLQPVRRRPAIAALDGDAVRHRANRGRGGQ